MIYLVLVLGLVVVASIAHLISTLVYRQMKKSGSSSAKTVRILTFIGAFVGLLAIVLYLIFTQVRFMR